MGFEVGRLAGDDGVIGAVRLVEAIVSKVLDSVKDGFGCLAIQPAVLRCTLDEMAAMLDEILLFLLGNRPSDQICFRCRIAGHIGQHFIDLFLIDTDAISRPQDRLQRGMGKLGLTLAMHTGDELVNKLQRTRTVKGDGRDDVLELGGL